MTDYLDRWLGLVLLPIISFAADGAIAILHFLRSMYYHFFRMPLEPLSLAKARAIDLSIQFSLFWMPLFVLIAWWTHKPFCLLFDVFEIAILVGACFLVNYVTADAKTNWAEGCAMVGFYTIIVSITLISFFIPDCLVPSSRCVRISMLTFTLV
jgi:Ca2+:H+ antiporter